MITRENLVLFTPMLIKNQVKFQGLFNEYCLAAAFMSVLTHVFHVVTDRELGRMVQKCLPLA